jgi:hypothetical protein
VEIIREYYEKFSEIFVASGGKSAVTKLKQIFKAEGPAEVAKVKEILAWIESLPISQLPYVEMGFDSLDSRVIDMLNDQRYKIQTDYNHVQLKVKQMESFKPYMIFAERFPYWSSPFSSRQSRDFKVGDRVINMNSTMRAYVPFGARGLVIGRTEDKVMVMFDNQFVGGNELYGQCQNYRGYMIEPNHLINVTKKFESALKKQGHQDKTEILNMFTEKSGDQQVQSKEEGKDELQKQKSDQKASKNSQQKMVYKAKSQNAPQQPPQQQQPAAAVPANPIKVQFPPLNQPTQDFKDLLSAMDTDSKPFELPPKDEE